MVEEENSEPKIFHFLPGNTVGGISIQTVHVASQLNEQGYENVIIVPDESGDVPDLAARRKVKVEKHPYRLPKHFEDLDAVQWNLRWSAKFLPSILELRRAYRSERPDIVHINGLMLLQPAIAAWLEGVDIVWYLVSDNIYPSWLVTLVIPLINHIATEIVLISESNREFYRQIDKDVTIIPGAIDIERIKPDSVDSMEVRRLAEKFHLSDNTTVITTVGKIHPMKGQEYAIKALASLNEEFAYLIVGPKRDSEYTESIEQMIKDCELEEHVHVTGFVEDKLAVLSLTDIFLLPSIGEGTPLSIMEALAMCTPVIATNVGGVPDLLDQGNTGQLIQPRSPESIRDAINRYLENPGLARDHASRGSKLVRSEYSISDIAEKYKTVYDACRPEEARD